MSDTPTSQGTTPFLCGSQDQTKVAAALCCVQSELPAVGFDSNNPFFRSRYASLGAVISASQPILKKHCLAVLQIPECNATDVKLHTRLVHASGQWLDGGTLTLPIGDPKGKSISQEVGSVITYLRRYAWATVLGMYADEDTDGNDPAKAPKSDSKPSQKAEDKKPTLPTEKTRLWALNKLQSAPGQPNRDIFQAFLEYRGWIKKGGTCEDWALEHVTASLEACQKLASEVVQWDTDRHAPSEINP